MTFQENLISIINAAEQLLEAQDDLWAEIHDYPDQWKVDEKDYAEQIEEIKDQLEQIAKNIGIEPQDES